MDRQEVPASPYGVGARAWGSREAGRTLTPPPLSPDTQAFLCPCLGELCPWGPGEGPRFLREDKGEVKAGPTAAGDPRKGRLEAGRCSPPPRLASGRGIGGPWDLPYLSLCACLYWGSYSLLSAQGLLLPVTRMEPGLLHTTPCAWHLTVHPSRPLPLSGPHPRVFPARAQEHWQAGTRTRIRSLPQLGGLGALPPHWSEQQTRHCWVRDLPNCSR